MYLSSLMGKGTGWALALTFAGVRRWGYLMESTCQSLQATARSSPVANSWVHF